MNFTPYKKIVLVVLDGFGIATPSRSNAVTQAKPATFDYLIDNYPSTTCKPRVHRSVCPGEKWETQKSGI
jgi:bisphosphoglycerate-independent phosphoglycerate mutase (AlkP superfamily)